MFVLKVPTVCFPAAAATRHTSTQQIHSNEALCIGEPRLEVQLMNMHREMNALACDSIIKRTPQTLNSKNFGFSGAFLFSKARSRDWYVRSQRCAEPGSSLYLRRTAQVFHIWLIKAGSGPGSVKLDWKLNSERGLASAGIRKFPCEKRERRRGEASCITSVAQHQCLVQRRLG